MGVAFEGAPALYKHFILVGAWRYQKATAHQKHDIIHAVDCVT
jgi:hypothetical protein